MTIIRTFSTIIIASLTLIACNTESDITQPPEEKVDTVVETESISTSSPTQTQNLSPTKETSNIPAASLTISALTTIQDTNDLNIQFSESVLEYSQTVWQNWAEGEIIGMCLIDNTDSITPTVKEAIIEHGVEKAFDELDGQNLENLSTIWDLCETLASTPSDENNSITATELSPATDLYFETAVSAYIVSKWIEWDKGQSMGDCLIESASSMTSETKEAVIANGIEEAFDALSGEHLNSLSEAWNTCDKQAVASQSTTTSQDNTTTSAVSDEPNTPRVTINIERDQAPTFQPSNTYESFTETLQTTFQAAVDTEFDQLTDKAGISIAVYSDGKLWKYAKGIATSSADMTVNTPIEIKSTSKTFMSALILDQVDDGMYSLSDTLSNVLADHPGYDSIDKDKINPDVTIDELLSMKSGLNTYLNSENVVAIETNYIWNPIEHLNMTPSGYNNPGAYKYNDTNTIILAIIAEHAAGKPLNHLYKSIFFDPLDISAALLPQDMGPSDTADEYGDRSKCGDNSGFGRMLDACSWYTKDEWLLSQGKNTWAAAGIVSTAESMARWGYEVYSLQGSAISPSARSKLLNSSSIESVIFANKPHHYGYHIAKYLMELGNDMTIDIYGHIGGGGKSVMYYSPEIDLSIAILANSSLDHNRGICGSSSTPFCILESIYGAYQ
jgi:CubicO group peptidase (beta-lactamase class C family)